MGVELDIYKILYNKWLSLQVGQNLLLLVLFLPLQQADTLKTTNAQLNTWNCRRLFLPVNKLSATAHSLQATWALMR